MTEVVTADQVVDEQIFGDIWAFLMDSYSHDAEKMVQATLSLKVAHAILSKELALPDFEVEVN